MENQIIPIVERIRADRTQFIAANSDIQILNEQQMAQAGEVLVAVKKRITFFAP